MSVTVERYAGAHRDLAWSFRLAEDSEEHLAGYIDDGLLWVARHGDEVLGHAHVMPREDRVWEVTNLAVVDSGRRRGTGRALLDQVVAEATYAGMRAVVLATGAADVGNLRFYQRCGFRMTRVVPDVFTPENGYPAGLEVDGIPLLDQVWFERRL